MEVMYANDKTTQHLPKVNYFYLQYHNYDYRVDDFLTRKVQCPPPVQMQAC